MKKVLLFGTFDGIHKGHRNLLQKAADMGIVHVIVARDLTVKKVKGRYPDHTEIERKKALEAEPSVHTVYLGSLGDKFARMHALAPDIILLGYDQEAFVEELYEYITRQNLPTTILRATPYKEHIYKTSLLRKKEKSEKKDNSPA